MKLTEAVRLYLSEPRSPMTNKQYGFVLDRLLKYLTGDVATVTPAMLADYVADLRQEKLPSGVPRKDSTIYGYTTVLKAFFAWCERAELIEHSPAAKLRQREPKPTTAASRAVPEVELRRMIEFWQFDPRNYALMLFLADTGCRVGGCASLQISRLDLGAREATIDEKGDRIHRVLFGPETAEALRRWLVRRPKVTHDFVWTGQGPDFRPLHREGIGYIVRTAAKNTGASRIYSAHSIRHYVGHKLAKNGVPVTIIQRKLGHSKPETTMNAYMPRDDQYLREVSDQYAMTTADHGQTAVDKVILVTNWRTG